VQLIKSLMLGAVLLSTAVQSSHGTPILYVATYWSDSVAEVDTTTNGVVRLSPAGDGANVVAYNPFNARMYVANWMANSVSVMDATSGDLIADIPVGEHPTALAISASGDFVYVAGAFDVRVIDVAIDAVVKVIPVTPIPFQLALDHTGKALYVSNTTQTVEVIDTTTNTVIGGVTGAKNAVGIAAHRTQPRLYIADAGNKELVVVDVPGNVIVSRIPIGPNPANVVLNPAGTRAYVADLTNSSVSVIDLATHTVIDTVVVGTQSTAARDLAIHPTAPILYVSLYFGAKVVTIDTNTNRVTGEIRTGQIPRVGPLGFGPRASSSPTVPVIEFYHSSLQHFFITWNIPEIITLDENERIRGWVRTTKWFKAYPSAQPGTQAVCRFYIPPGLGDSHFFGRDVSECADTKAKFPALIEEDPRYMHLQLPTSGNCPEKTFPVYRAFNNRPDANHRYSTERAAIDQVVAQGWIAEGDGPDRVVMCAPG
jgi:YVTN family beta-propeller protein